MQVAITMRVDAARGGQDVLEQNYLNHLVPFGITPILVPNTLSDPAAYYQEMGAQGLILTGGNDLSPETYKAKRTFADGDNLKRDQTETALLDYTLQINHPVLGICRGLHLINAYFGGGLTQDLEQEMEGAGKHIAVEHDLCITHDSFEKLLGTRAFSTNSYHHQGVQQNQLAPSLEALAQTDDGLVEALHHPGHRLAAVQWHPERPTPSTAQDHLIIEAFLAGTSYWEETK